MGKLSKIRISYNHGGHEYNDCIFAPSTLWGFKQACKRVWNKESILKVYVLLDKVSVFKECELNKIKLLFDLLEIEYDIVQYSTFKLNLV